MEELMARQVDKLLQGPHCGSDVDSDDFLSERDDELSLPRLGKAKGGGGRKGIGSNMVRVKEAGGKNVKKREISKGWRVDEFGSATRKCPHGVKGVEGCAVCVKELVKIQHALLDKEEKNDSRNDRIFKRVEAHRRKAVDPSIHECRYCHVQLNSGICTECNLVKRPHKSWRCYTCSSPVSTLGHCLNSYDVIAAVTSSLPAIFSRDILYQILSFSAGDLGPPHPRTPLITMVRRVVSTSSPYHYDQYNQRRAELAK